MKEKEKWDSNFVKGRSPYHQAGRGKIHEINKLRDILGVRLGDMTYIVDALTIVEGYASEQRPDSDETY